MRAGRRRRVPPACVTPPSRRHGRSRRPRSTPRCGRWRRCGRATCWCVPGGQSGGRVAVLSTAQRKGGDVLGVRQPDRAQGVSCRRRDFPAPPRARGARSSCPAPYLPNNHAFRRRRASPARPVQAARRRAADAERDRRRRRPRRCAPAEAVAAHRWPTCPDLEPPPAGGRSGPTAGAARWSELERRIRGRTESLARQFDRVLRVLEAWGYVDGWALTDAGERLAGCTTSATCWSPSACGRACSTGSTPAEVAGLASVFTYEHRGAGDPPAPVVPARRAARALAAASSAGPELVAAEEDAGLPLTRPPDPGFVAAGLRVGGRGATSTTSIERRGDVRRRLRPQHQAAHRPAAPAGRRRRPEPATAAACRGGRRRACSAGVGRPPPRCRRPS